LESCGSASLKSCRSLI